MYTCYLHSIWDQQPQTAGTGKKDRVCRRDAAGIGNRDQNAAARTEASSGSSCGDSSTDALYAAKTKKEEKGMRKQQKRIKISLPGHKIFLLLLLLAAAGFTSSGEEFIQKKGLVRIQMCYEQRAVSGGTVTLYQVGRYEKETEGWQLRLSDGFAGWETEFAGWTENEAFPENIFHAGNRAECASRLSAYAAQKNLPGITETTDADGTAEFENLSCGLYLLTQSMAADGYEKMEPFLLLVPTKEEGGLVYEVTAYPKLEWKTENPKETEDADETEQESSKEPETEQKNSERDKESGDTEKAEPEFAEQVRGWLTLPQTGQLKWPVLALAGGGILMFALGKIMQRKK